MSDKKTIRLYDSLAENYHIQYSRDTLHNLELEYPANYFRMQLLINSFIENEIFDVVEIGTGEGSPLIQLAKSGINVCGIDISDNMVSKAKDNFTKNGLDPNQIHWGDIQDPMTYTQLFKRKFDGLLAMGVMPHIQKDTFVLKNMKNLIKPGGKVFIEFRNQLFSLFTFNKYTKDFILNELLRDVDHELKTLVNDELDKRCSQEKTLEDDHSHAIYSSEAKISYDDLDTKFHNPFEIKKVFLDLGFKDIKLLFYHYHPAMPTLESKNRELFRSEAMKLEHEQSGWRGLFLCSAFVIEATA